VLSAELYMANPIDTGLEKLTAAPASSTAVVLFAMYCSSAHVGSARVVLEGVEAARQLRRVASPAVPTLLYANHHAMALLPSQENPWDERIEMGLDPRVQAWMAALSARRRRALLLRAAPYLFKLSALLHVRADAALFLDCDVLVLQPAFAHDMLHSVLRVADVAMPLDPGREPHLTDGTPPWATATAGPPPLCSAVLAFRKTNATDALWLGAAYRLVQTHHPRARQGDQEMIWYEWVSGSNPGLAHLRVTALPEEYYCPLEERSTPKAALGSSTWRTSWRRGVYRCRAVHGHSYFRAAREHFAAAVRDFQQRRPPAAAHHGRGRRLSATAAGVAGGTGEQAAPPRERPVCSIALSPSPNAGTYHSYWAVPPAVQFVADQPCGIEHASLGRSHALLPVTRVGGIAEVEKAELGLWFYHAEGCSDFGWDSGRSLLARNKHDALLKLAARYWCLLRRRRHRRSRASPHAGCALARPLALKQAARWLWAHGREYAIELLNRSRHHPRFAAYFERLAARTSVSRSSELEASEAGMAGAGAPATVGVRRSELSLTVLLDDAAAGNRPTEESPGCNVHVPAGSPTLCAGACAERLKALAFVHQREGLLDYVNVRLLKKLVGTALELDTITLHHQPQGTYSLRTHAELWDVRHLHSEYVPSLPAFRMHQRMGTRALHARLNVEKDSPIEWGGSEHILHRPYALAVGSQPRGGSQLGAGGCSLWAGWQHCMACNSSLSQMACTAITPAGRAWFNHGARGLLAPTSPSECGGLDPQHQTTDVCKARRLEALLDVFQTYWI
jgi:hypothetical protein